MKKIAILFAAGSGTRMNTAKLPKPFLNVNGCPVIVYTARWFQEHDEIDEIVIVCAKEWILHMKKLVKDYSLTKAWVVEGGSTAMESQYRGICAVREKYPEAIVLMHDGVRPLISKQLISECIHSVETKGSAVTVAPASETLLSIGENNDVKSVHNRSECRLGRAPQCFYLSKLLDMHERAKKEPSTGIVDSASLFFHFGEQLYTVDGPAENIKLTTPSDYYFFKAIIDARESQQFNDI